MENSSCVSAPTLACVTPPHHSTAEMRGWMLAGESKTLWVPPEPFPMATRGSCPSHGWEQQSSFWVLAKISLLTPHCLLVSFLAVPCFWATTTGEN